MSIFLTRRVEKKRPYSNPGLVEGTGLGQQHEKENDDKLRRAREPDYSLFDAILFLRLVRGVEDDGDGEGDDEGSEEDGDDRDGSESVEGGDGGQGSDDEGSEGHSGDDGDEGGDGHNGDDGSNGPFLITRKVQGDKKDCQRQNDGQRLPLDQLVPPQVRLRGRGDFHDLLLGLRVRNHWPEIGLFFG